MCLTHSQEIEKLATALAKAQGMIEDAVKDSDNPAFKQNNRAIKYADLSSVRAAIRKPLSDSGLSYVQFPEAEGNKVSCETMLMHESGQWIRGKLTMIATQTTPQGVGSAITYCRRYSLMAVIGIAPAEDDDGNAASAKPPQDNYRPEPQRNETPFDDFPGDQPAKVIEPAVSTKAIKMGREVKDCKNLNDLDALKKTSEFTSFWVSANAVDRAHVQKAAEAVKNQVAADMIGN